ncbi:glycosyltransferase [Paenibacillus sp. MER TA 81-3]|uniref:CgeB family protein n=1 Tax=Paenibacillus sp. MER TA 81-3 TaxID=2939573 RepID=UPI00203ADB7D|nr:glycosyltransferase [Paenibacillus sp. MER TA 81-3]MCM3339045.1 glycosyltransferase [Paenibacillus sp. MER TA 81-3]
MRKDRNTKRTRIKTHAFRSGYSEGYRMGLCEATVQRTPKPQLSSFDLRVLYVPQGFDAIDRGVCEALTKLTRECAQVEPAQMAEAAERMKPDLVLVMNGLHVYPPEHLEHIGRLRQMGMKTAVWFVDDPYFSEDTAAAAPYYDFIFTHERSGVSFYKQLGCSRVFHLPLGAGISTFRPLRAEPAYSHDICFIGNAFWNRVNLFDHMASFLADKKVIIAGGHWERLSRYAVLRPHIRQGWVPIEETATYYNGAKIVINVHRPVEHGSDNRNSHQLGGESINPRTYEISACGTLQMTDVRSELAEMYTPGVDIETFTSPEELMSKIDYYLKHETIRQRVAVQGLHTTLLKHTFEHRVQRLLETFVSS